jgi:O-antigen ligase
MPRDDRENTERAPAIEDRQMDAFILSFGLCRDNPLRTTRNARGSSCSADLSQNRQHPSRRVTIFVASGISSAMRFVGIFLVLAILPVLVYCLKTYPQYRKWAAFGIGILPFTLGLLNLDAALVSWRMWPGYSKGMLLTALDSLALAVVIVSRKPFNDLPLMLAFGAYILATLLSVAFSGSAMSSFFYVFQLLRVFVVFVAVASLVTEKDGLRYLALGLASGASIQGGLVLDQRLSGAVQAAGSMGHQNLLGMMLHFVTLPLLAMLLAGMRSKLAYLGIAAGLMAVAFGASRASIGFAAMGVVLLMILSFARGMSPRKWQVAGFGVLALAVAAPVMHQSLERRYDIKGDPESGTYDERAAFERAAKMMWTDHPMGVGANQYVVYANTEGYSERAGVIWNWGSRSANVHHLYLLAGAETGYLGFATLVGLIGWAIFLGYRLAFAMRDDPRGDVVLGFTVAITVMAVHSFWEWIFVMSSTQYMFAIALGVVAGYARDVARRKRAPQARSQRPVRERRRLVKA